MVFFFLNAGGFIDDATKLVILSLDSRSLEMSDKPNGLCYLETLCSYSCGLIGLALLFLRNLRGSLLILSLSSLVSFLLKLGALSKTER